MHGNLHYVRAWGILRSPRVVKILITFNKNLDIIGSIYN